MPKLEYATCRNCGRHRDEAGTMSRTRLCTDCGGALERANALGIHQKSGPYFRKWRRAMAASVGGILMDDLVDDLAASE